jgi:ABC-type multidrug transport system ATPase subunit
MDTSSGEIAMAAQAPFLVADQLTRSYGTTIALDHIDLAACEGSVLAVLGPNGCGKTTTVRIFATLLRADSGCALVGGHDVLTEAAAVRALIGLAGQLCGGGSVLDRPGEPGTGG